MVFAWLLAQAGARAEETGTATDAKLVTGRLGAGVMVDSRYVGSADSDVFPVPLAALEIGDVAYVNYWQAGAYVLGNEAKTLGLAVVATPRLGFNSGDGKLLAGMSRRKWSIEAGLSIDYGSNDTGVSLGYLHDITGASDGGVTRLIAFKRLEFTERFGVDVFADVERLDARLANYYFGVGAGEATPARPFYQPGAATDVGAGLHFNFDFGARSTLLFGYEITRLGNALVDSPVVERRFSSLFYLGYGWRL